MSYLKINEQRKYRKNGKNIGGLTERKWFLYTLKLHMAAFEPTMPFKPVLL